MSRSNLNSSTSGPNQLGGGQGHGQASTSGAPPPYSMTLPMIRGNEDKERRTNALQILKLLCESPLLQVHLLELLQAR